MEECTKAQPLVLSGERYDRVAQILNPLLSDKYSGARAVLEGWTITSIETLTDSLTLCLRDGSTDDVLQIAVKILGDIYTDDVIVNMIPIRTKSGEDLSL